MKPKQSKDILAEIKKKGTFQLTPEDEPFVQDASSQGFTEQQILKGLEAKKKLIASGTSIETVNTQVTKKPFGEVVTTGDQTVEPVTPTKTTKDIPWESYLAKAQELSKEKLTPEMEKELKIQYNQNIVTPEQKQVAEDPFGGLTKQEVIVKAYKTGITSPTALKQIAETFDLIKGTKENTDEFTSTEKRKLEQAGLLDSPRKEQLDYLYAE